MNDIPELTDPRHREFAKHVLMGEPAAKAYGLAGFRAKTPASRAAAAHRLLKNVDIARYLAAMRKQADAKLAASIEAKRDLLFRAMFTPLLSIDPNNPGVNGDILKKYKRTVSVRGEDETLVMEEWEKLDPLKAMQIDNDMAGIGNPEAEAMSGLAAALAGLAAGPAVDDVM
jgi:hypothetical protein